MKLISTIVIAIILVISISAQEDAKYNFGSMQANKEITIVPGNEFVTKLYFYNVYGNQNTHVSLEVTEKPDDWEVKINPGLAKESYDVSGIIIEVEENLFIEPGKIYEIEPEEKEQGLEYISSSQGYLGAKAVEVTIKVPKNEKIGKEFDIVVSATAFWLGQGGVALKQARDFTYKVKTISEEFYERPISGEIKEPSGITGFAVGFVEGSPVSGILVAIVIIVVGLAIYLLIAKAFTKKRGK